MNTEYQPEQSVVNDNILQWGGAALLFIRARLFFSNFKVWDQQNFFFEISAVSIGVDTKSYRKRGRYV